MNLLCRVSTCHTFRILAGDEPYRMRAELRCGDFMRHRVMAFTENIRDFDSANVGAYHFALSGLAPTLVPKKISSASNTAMKNQ